MWWGGRGGGVCVSVCVSVSECVCGGVRTHTSVFSVTVVGVPGLSVLLLLAS